MTGLLYAKLTAGIIVVVLIWTFVDTLKGE